MATWYVRSGGPDIVGPANSCADTDVQAAINAAASGDTIQIGAGSCTWTTSVANHSAGVSKYVKIYGAGTMPLVGAATSVGTTITVNFSSNTAFNLLGSAAGSVELANISMVQGSALSAFGMIFARADTGVEPILVHHMTMTSITCDPSFKAITWDGNRGVIYRNKFIAPALNTVNPLGSPCTTNASMVLSHDPANTTSSWTTAHTLGTADATGKSNLYFETNHITNFITAMTDLRSFARAVLRYNTIVCSSWNGHGFDSSEGVRQWEFYNNTYSCSDSTANLQQFLFQRGGTGIVTDETFGEAFNGASPVQPIKFSVYAIRLSGLACYKTYPAPRQIGQSHDGATAITDPVYIWNITDAGSGHFLPYISDPTPNGCGAPEVWARFDAAGQTESVDDFIKVNRDYVLGARPGYTKYTYPHPLATVTGTDIVAETTAPILGTASRGILRIRRRHRGW